LQAVCAKSRTTWLAPKTMRPKSDKIKTPKLSPVGKGFGLGPVAGKTLPASVIARRRLRNALRSRAPGPSFRPGKLAPIRAAGCKGPAMATPKTRNATGNTEAGRCLKLCRIWGTFGLIVFNAGHVIRDLGETPCIPAPVLVVYSPVCSVSVFLCFVVCFLWFCVTASGRQPLRPTAPCGEPESFKRTLAGLQPLNLGTLRDPKGL
jgi:hypothetical protein